METRRACTFFTVRLIFHSKCNAVVLKWMRRRRVWHINRHSFDMLFCFGRWDRMPAVHQYRTKSSKALLAALRPCLWARCSDKRVLNAANTVLGLPPAFASTYLCLQSKQQSSWSGGKMAGRSNYTSAESLMQGHVVPGNRRPHRLLARRSRS